MSSFQDIKEEEIEKEKFISTKLLLKVDESTESLVLPVFFQLW